MRQAILRHLTPLAEGIEHTENPCDEATLRKLIQSLYRELDDLLNVTGTFGKGIHTGHGVALAPFNAAYCLLDTDRSFTFMKGMIEAIEAAKLRFPDQKIHILYAGTGPFASLILPLTQRYTPDEIGITALDIQSSAIVFLKKLIEELELEHYFLDFITHNAITYQHKGEPVMILLSETMSAGLLEEPQAAVFHNLESCVHPDGFLIPEKVRLWVSAALTHDNMRVLPEKSPLGDILHADRNWYRQYPFNLRQINTYSSSVPVPAHEKNRQTFLETDIQVFNERRMPERKGRLCSPIKAPLTLSTAWRDDRDLTLHLRFILGGTIKNLHSRIY